MSTAKVSAIRTDIFTGESRPNTGSISAYKMIQARGFHCMSFHKRVRIGVEFGVTVDTAKEMMREIRENNKNDEGYPASDILGRFVMEL